MTTPANPADASAKRQTVVRIRLPADKLKKLSQISSQNGLRNSDYLRTLIFSHLAKLFPEATNNGP